MSAKQLYPFAIKETPDHNQFGLDIDGISREVLLVKHEAIYPVARVLVKGSHVKRQGYRLFIANGDRWDCKPPDGLRLKCDLIVHPALSLAVGVAVLAAGIDAHNMKVRT